MSSTYDVPPGIEGLFAVLGAIYGSKFADAYRTSTPEVMKSVWREGLRGFSPAELDRGVRACQSRQWPPTLPEFRVLCRPALDSEAAWAEASVELSRRERDEPERWSHPAVFFAAREFRLELKTSNFSKERHRWERALSEAFEAVDSGALPAEVPPKPLAIKNDPKPVPMPAAVRERLASLGIRLGERAAVSDTNTTTTNRPEEDHAAS